MTDQLLELANNSERGRKHWKQTGLNAEKRVQDAQLAMEKAKAKYNSLSEQYDRVRTGERAGGKFGLKKSGAQEEENLSRKLEAADGDYSFKAQAAQTMQQELLSTLRPQAVNALQELIFETDAGLTVHIQKFAAQSEKLLLGYGLSITPLKGANPSGGSPSKSLREIASSINNDKDFADHILSLSNKVPPQQYMPSNAGDTYGQQNYPNHNRQVSGVTSSQGPSHEDGYGYPGSSPQLQQQPGNQGPGQSFTAPTPNQQFPARQASMDTASAPSTAPGQVGSGAPQLPQIESFATDRFAGQTSGVISTPPPGQNNLNDQASFGSSLDPNNAPTGGSGPGQGPPGFSGATRGGGAAGAGAGARPPGAMRQPSSESQPTGPGGPGAGPRPTGPPQGAGRGAAPMGRGAPPGAGRGAPPGSGPEYGGPAGAGRGLAGRGAPMGSGPRAGGNVGAGRGAPGPGSEPPQGLSQPPSNGALRSQAGPGAGPAGGPNASRGPAATKSALPPLKPVFGVSLDDLFQREGSAVPTIVYQCIQAVDLYGLDTEGIYRTSGSAHHIMELRQQFDHGKAATLISGQS